MGRATEAFNKEAAVLDHHLSARSYLVGSNPTFADFTVVAPLVYAREAGMPLEGHTHVRNWSARVLAMPARRDTAPRAPAAVG